MTCRRVKYILATLSLHLLAARSSLASHGGASRLRHDRVVCLLINIKDAHSRISCTECELTRCVCESATKNTFWQVSDHCNDIATFVVKDSHFILSCTASEDHILPLIKHACVDEGSDHGLIRSSRSRLRRCGLRTCFTSLVLFLFRLCLIWLSFRDGRLAHRICICLGLLR